MRKIPRRSARLLQAMREDASPRYYDPVKTPAQVRDEARQRLATVSYAGKPVAVGPALAERLVYPA